MGWCGNTGWIIAYSRPREGREGGCLVAKHILSSRSPTEKSTCANMEEQNYGERHILTSLSMRTHRPPQHGQLNTTE
jgi:hypothetical protein